MLNSYAETPPSWCDGPARISERAISWSSVVAKLAAGAQRRIQLFDFDHDVRHRADDLFPNVLERHLPLQQRRTHRGQLVELVDQVGDLQERVVVLEARVRCPRELVAEIQIPGPERISVSLDRKQVSSQFREKRSRSR